MTAITEFKKVDRLNKIKGYIYVALSAVVYGCMPLMAVNIYADGVNSISLVLLRSLLAVPAFFVLAVAKKVDLRIKTRDLLKTAGVFVMGSAVTPVLLFSSYNYISTGTATTLHFVYPALVVVGCALLFKEPAGKVQCLCALLCCVGAMMFCSFDGSFNFTGAGLAVVSGVTYAAYMIGLEKSGAGEIQPLKYCLYGSLGCSILMAVITASTGSLKLPQSAKGWAISAFFAIMVMLVAVMFFQIGVGFIGSKRAAILSTFEPITGMLVGVLVFNEPFGIKSAIGTVAILSSVVLLAVFDKNKN